MDAAPDEQLLPKRLRCWDEHVRELNTAVLKLRKRKRRKVPFFDPAGGGANARMLLLLHSAQSGALRSGFVSMDNDDGTARNLRRIVDKLNIDDREIVLWNHIPWATTRYTKPAYIEGWEHLRSIRSLFTNARVIVSLDSSSYTKELHEFDRLPNLIHFRTVSASPRARLSYSDASEQILDTLRDAWTHAVRIPQ